MLELGDDENRLHFNVGEKINAKEINYCLFYGPLSKHMYQGALKTFQVPEPFILRIRPTFAISLSN